MATPTDAQLHRLVEISENVADLEARVYHHFGPEHICAAKLLAVKENGARWVFGPIPPPPSRADLMLKGLRRNVPQIVVIASALALAVAVFFPPFLFVDQGGTSYHMGFHSIFSVPSGDNLGYGNVNVPLLAIECLAIVAIGAASFYVARYFTQPQ